MVDLLQIENIHKAYQQTPILDKINLTIKQGEFVSLLGPSGCGKTTLLKLIAGFESPDDGNLYINGQNVNNLPPQKRNVHTVFQNYALFPHLTVYDNVAFPLRAQGANEKTIKEKVSQKLNLVQLAHLADRYPEALSGGQQQRVAIARAIINQPDILLLDESLSALDSKLRKQMQIELKQLQRQLGITFIYVTHSQSEALSMSDRIIVMNNGQVQQVGSPRDIYEDPKNLFVAKFIGEANIFDLPVLTANPTELTVEIEGKTFSFENNAKVTSGQQIHFIVRPEDLRIWSKHEVDSTEEMIPATVEEIIYKGSTVDLLVKLPSGKLLSATEFFDEDDEELEYSLNENVWVHWPRGWEVILKNEDTI